MLGSLGPMELIIILAIAILLFGPSRIPKLGRGVGDTIREFRNAFKELDSAERDVKREVHDTPLDERRPR